MRHLGKYLVRVPAEELMQLRTEAWLQKTRAEYHRKRSERYERLLIIAHEKSKRLLEGLEAEGVHKIGKGA